MSSNEPNEQAAHITNLQESFSKQQKKISALKELVRKSEVAHGKSTSSAQEKVKNIAQRLTHLKIKARSRQNASEPTQKTALSMTTSSKDAEMDPAAQCQSPFIKEQPQTQKSIHSISYVDQSVVTPLADKSSAPQFAPLKSQHRSDSSKSLSNILTPGSEKIVLLRQQMEQNKLLMAQRASSKQHLENLVSQLKEKFDTTQQCLEDTTELGKSMNDLSVLMVRLPVSRERHKSATDLSSQPFSLEKERIKFLENRCRLLEKQLEKERQMHSSNDETGTTESASIKRVKELENKVLELEKALQAYRLEIASKEEDISQKSHDIVDMRALIAAKDEEILMLRLHQSNQTNDFNEFSEVGSKSEIELLRNELTQNQRRIIELEETNVVLETTRCDLALKNSKVEEELLQLRTELNASNEKLQESESKCSSLEKIVEQMQNSTEAVIVEHKMDTYNQQVNTEMAKQIQELQDACQLLREQNERLMETINDREKLEVSDAIIAEKIDALEATIESQREDLKNRITLVNSLEESVMEKTIQLNVLNANMKVLEEKLEASNKSKSLFSSRGDTSDSSELEGEVQQLKQKLDESNKAMIKLKLKYKQSEKQVEKLNKGSDLHGEIVRLKKLNEELQQKVTELEDEKGQWQLSQVEFSNKASASESSDENQNIEELKNLCKTQKETIRLLEEQKFERAQKLADTEGHIKVLEQEIYKMTSEETARVKSEMSEINLEEQVEELIQKIKTLENNLAKATEEAGEYKIKLKNVEEQKEVVDKKLENYIVENMELLDKIEKLSKSSSSAESIEIVERLTQQERAEIDEFNKRMDENVVSSVNELTQTELGPELSDSLLKLREESSELMGKIELFTAERREVLERMELLTAENHDMINKVEELTREKEEMETNLLLANDVKDKLEKQVEELIMEKDVLNFQVAEFKAQGTQLSQELASLHKSSEVVAALDSKEDASLFEKCEKSLLNLNTEIETYRKAGDRNAKFNASKKLVKEAKNAHVQLSELLQKVKEASTAVETVTVVETVVAVTAPNGKALAEYEQLTAQNRELKATIEDLRRTLEESRETEPVVIVPEPTVIPALTDNKNGKENDASIIDELNKNRERCLELQSIVENLRIELMEARTANKEKTQEITQLNTELESLRLASQDFDSLLFDNNVSHEKEVKELTRLRRELEGKCETYEVEMGILQTLVSEQKQQLIEAYKEHEHEINMKLLELQQRDEQIHEQRNELKALKNTLQSAGDQLSEDLRKECEKLRESLKINKGLVAEQVNELSNKQETIETLNQQIIDLYKTMEENANKLIEKEDEISYLQEMIDVNSNDLESLRKDNNEQKQVVDKLLGELHSHRATAEQLPQLEKELQRLQWENKELDTSNKDLEHRNKEQLDKLKKFAANLKKRTLHCQELEIKMKELEKQNEEVLQSKTKNEIKEQQSMEIELKTAEIFKVIELNNKLKSDLDQLQQSVVQKDIEIVHLRDALTAAHKQNTDWDYVESSSIKTNNNFDDLVKQLEEKTTSLERAETDMAIIQEELTRVQQENLVAINEIQEMLKQKSDIIAGLQQQMQTRTEVKDLQEKLQTQETRLREVTEELKVKSLKFEKSKAVIKERNNQIHRLQAQLKDLHDKMNATPEEGIVAAPVAVAKLSDAANIMHRISKTEYDELKSAYDKLNDKFKMEQANFQVTVDRLETLHDGIQAKLQENISYIESLEQENAKFKEKICKLEEGIAMFEERRASMERRTNMLCAQMQTRENEYEKAEDELIYRLNMLSEHDEVIGQRLLDTQDEKDDLQERVDRMQDEFSKINSDYRKLQEDYKKYRNEFESNLEAETQSLREQLSTVSLELERSRSVFDAKLAAKTTELDELECELNEQLSKMNNEKRALLGELERSRDDCSEQKDEVVRLKESLNALEQVKQELEREVTWLRMQSENSQQDHYDLQELRMQTMQDKTEIDNLRHQIETLSNNHEVELQGLRTQISELDTLRMQVGQNQTDDQVFIESENKRLTDLLAEKEAIIDNYQRQNLQLQMAATAASQLQISAPHDPSALPFGVRPTESASPQQTMSAALNEERDRDRLQRELNAAQAEVREMIECNQDLQRQLLAKNSEIENLRNTTVPRFANDMIPASSFFFPAEQTATSPFDEIVQVRSAENVERSRRNHDIMGINSIEQPTIEDLQRNVSDLEKHAQDLENKLASRNLELEERRQNAFSELELQIRDRDQELNNAREEQKKIFDEFSILKQTEETLQQNTEKLMCRLGQVEYDLSERNHQIEKLQQKLQSQAAANDNHVGQLQTNVEQLQTLLQLREDELTRLKSAFNEERALKESVKSLESQIIPNELADLHADSSKGAAPTLDMFFGSTSGTSDFENIVVPTVSLEPVVEDAIVPEKAYICYPDDPAHINSDGKITALDLGGDWGESWGIQEAEAEAEHFSKATSSLVNINTSLVPREQKLEIELQEKVERIQELELAIERCEQQKQEMQVKSGKLMKKLKEYKLQSGANVPSSGKSTTAESLSLLSNLDATIQEELKAQVKTLEEKLQELKKSNESQAMEKEKLLKRIRELNDRMAEMKDRQDMDVQMYQARIKKLQETLNRLNDWGADAAHTEQLALQDTPRTYSQPPQSDCDSSKLWLEQRISDLTTELQDVNGDKQELQAMLDDEKANGLRLEEMVELLTREISSSNLESHANENAEKSKYNSLKLDYQNLLEKYNDAHATIENQSDKIKILKDQVENLKSKLIAAENELTSLREEIVKLETQQEVLQNEILKLNKEREQLRTQSDSTAINDKDQLVIQLQERDSEIMHLKQRIEDLMREDQTEKLVLEILTKNQEIHLLKIQIKNLEDEKQELEHNLSVQITNEMQANKSGSEKENVKMLEQIQNLEEQVREMLDDKKNMEEELNVLNNHVLSTLENEDKLKTALLELDTKSIEIMELRKTIETLRTSDKISSELALNTQWEAIIEQRCSEIAKLWRDHLEQREIEFKQTETRLQEEITTLRNTQPSEPARQGLSGDTTATTSPASESTTASGTSSAAASKDGTPLRHRLINEENESDADTIVEKMQAALESQEMEIVTLKEQLAIRSAEYARLAAQYDPFKLQSTTSHSGLNAISGGGGPVSADLVQGKRIGTSGNDSSLVPKSELDFALYMLHQRDMRCEEMTVELVSLLEERDTLQLKLSNTLRQVEVIKASSNYVEPPENATTIVPTTDTTHITSSNLNTTADDNKNELSQKLSQLQTVNHSKDKMIKEERDQRIRQMEKIQQDVAKMPLAAVSELVGTDPNQTGQSPSSVLLNWLWGNNPHTGGGAPH